MRISDWSSDVCSSDLEAFLFILRIMLEALGLEGCSETKTALANALHDRRGQFLAVGEDAMPPTMLTMIALRKNDHALLHRELLVPASNPLLEALQHPDPETPHLLSVLDRTSTQR